MLGNMKLLVLTVCVSLSSAAFFHGLQTGRNGALTSIAKQSVGAALANHLATKGNAYGVGGNIQGISYGIGSPVVAGYNQGIGYGVGAPVIGGNAQGIAYGVATPVLAGNTQGISYGVGTTVAAGYTPGITYGGASPIIAGNTQYAAAPVTATAAGQAPGAASSPKYSGPLNMNKNLVDYPNGAKVPADEPAVAAARAAHLSATAGAATVSAPTAASGYGYSGSLNMNTRLVDYPNGAKVPADEPAVAAARAAHLNKKAGNAASAPIGALVSHANGAVVPADEPAVAAARAAHLSEKAATVAFAPYGGHVSHSNGAVVPAYEPAVAAARAAHLNKMAAADASSSGLVSHPNGAVVPVDTPALAAARAEHLAARRY